MLCLKVGVSLASGKVVLQVVVLHLQSNGISRVNDSLHILEVVRTMVVCE